jgi:hypothetical protein
MVTKADWLNNNRNVVATVINTTLLKEEALIKYIYVTAKIKPTNEAIIATLKYLKSNPLMCFFSCPFLPSSGKNVFAYALGIKKMTFKTVIASADKETNSLAPIIFKITGAIRSIYGPEAFDAAILIISLFFGLLPPVILKFLIFKAKIALIKNNEPM